MKVIILIGSNRKNGNTERMCSLIEEELQAIVESQQETLEAGMAFQNMLKAIEITEVD